MKKFRLLLLDANIIIELFRLGIWEKVIEKCTVSLARSVTNEAHFFEDEEEQRHDFDLREYEESERIQVFSMTLSDIGAFSAQFDPVYFEKLDLGETESLAYLLRLDSAEDCYICSADKIIFRVLGNLSRGEQGISLEEILQQIGLGRELGLEFSKAYKVRWIKKGFEEGLQGIGLRE